MRNGRLHQGLVIDYEDLIHKMSNKLSHRSLFCDADIPVGRLVMIIASTKLHKSRVVV